VIDLKSALVFKNGAREAFATKDLVAILCFAVVAALVHALDTMHAELRMKKE
jgi:hypothetical protein